MRETQKILVEKALGQRVRFFPIKKMMFWIYALIALLAITFLFAKKININDKITLANDIQYETYSVEPGDTLKNVSEKFRISVGAIASFNRIKNFADIKNRVFLRIPSKDGFYRYKKSGLVYEEFDFPQWYTDSYSGISVNQSGLGGGIKTSDYGSRKNPFLQNNIGGFMRKRWGKNLQEFHQGIDLGALVGTPVYFSLKNAVVFQTGRIGVYGKTVVLFYKGYKIYLGHLSEILVEEGDVLSGDKDLIALVGNTGKSTGPHLHFEVRRKIKGKWQPVDPDEFFAHVNPLIKMRKNLENMIFQGEGAQAPR